MFKHPNFFTAPLLCIALLLGGCKDMGVNMVDDPDQEGYFTLTKKQHETHPEKTAWVCVKSTSGQEICGMGCKAGKKGVRCDDDSTERK